MIYVFRFNNSSLLFAVAVMDICDEDRYPFYKSELQNLTRYWQLIKSEPERFGGDEYWENFEEPQEMFIVYSAKEAEHVERFMRDQSILPYISLVEEIDRLGHELAR